MSSLEETLQLDRVLEPFDTIVLVANSDEVDLGKLMVGSIAEGALFVFFNKVYKVLDSPFGCPSILVARSSPAGANIVYRREVGDVLRYLPAPAFSGIVNLKAGGREQFSPTEAFNGAAVAHLDLEPEFRGFYPPTHVPTSGFALALHLLRIAPSKRVVLAGFTGRRSLKWRLFNDHDWTFEQIVLRLLTRSGRLSMVQPDVASEHAFASAIAGRFPDLAPEAIALVSSEVLSERMDTANAAIDDLIKLTRLQRWSGDVVRRLRPKTRKERFAERSDREAGG